MNLFLDTLNKIIIFGLECCVMGEEDKKEEYKIKAGEFGFFKGLDDKDFDYKDLINKGKITVLTGKNGCGKTQILKYIAKKHANETIFNTTEFEKSENKNRFGKDYKEYKAETSSDFLNEILFETRLKNKTELTNALFKRNDSLYKEHREDTIKIIVDRIKKYKGEDVANDFLNCFGIPSEKDINEAKYGLHRDTVAGNYVEKTQKNKRIKWLEEQYADENNNFEEKVKKYAIDHIIQYKKHINKFNNFSDFTRKLNSDLFNEIDINNLIKELADDIFLDYKEKRKVELSKWASINTELEEQNHYFNYKLVEPDKNLQEYIMEFEYIGVDDDLKNHGVVHFDYLSTGEKKIFTLIVYKYLLTIAENKTKYKYLLLDEFDANLNPALINFYVETLAKISKGNTELCIIITTHSALTLKSLQKKELFQDSKAVLYELKKNIQEKEHKTKQIGKEELDEFIYKYSDGLLLYNYSKIKEAEYIIIVEGKDDQEYIETYLNYIKKNNFYIVTLNMGSPRVKECLIDLNRYFKDEDFGFKNKKFILLYDFDQAGYDSGLKPCINGTKVDTFIANTKIGNLKDWNLNNINKENILAMMLEPIKEEDFKNDIIKTYHYSNNIDKMLKKTVLDFEIEDLIVAYNVYKYNGFLSTPDKKELNIKNFFNGGETKKKHKKTVKSFFGEKHKDEDFNFAGFDELFKRIEANFTPASKNSQGVDDEKGQK